MASLDTGATLQADTVVLCMGPWTGRGLRWGGVDRELVSGTRAHSITLQLRDPATSAIDNTALFLSSLKEPEVYPRPDGTVYMCGGCSSDHAPLPPHPREVAVDTAACAQIKETAGAVSAELGAVTRYTPSACYLPHSEDGAPLIGHLDQVTIVTSDQVIVRRSNLPPRCRAWWWLPATPAGASSRAPPRARLWPSSLSSARPLMWTCGPSVPADSPENEEGIEFRSHS